MSRLKTSLPVIVLLLGMALSIAAAYYGTIYKGSVPVLENEPLR